jgi:hypothetical protein
VNVVVRFKRVTKRLVKVNGVGVFATFASDCQVTNITEFMNNAVHCAFLNTHELGHFAEPYIGLLSDADEDMRVVRKKRPRVLGGFLL